MNSMGDLVNRVMYHEMVHVVQNNAKGKMPWYFIEGIADFIRLRLMLGAKHWRRKQGSSYKGGYETTGYFLDYCDKLKPGLVCGLNEWAGENEWVDDTIFSRLAGKDVLVLWDDYQTSIKA